MWSQETPPFPVPLVPVPAGLSCASSGRRILEASPSGRGASRPRPLTALCWRVRAARPHPLPGWPVWDPSCHITREILHFLDSASLDGIGLLSAFSHQSIDIKVFYFFPSLLLSPLYQIHIFCLLTTSWGESKLFSQFSLLKLV